MKVRVTQRKIRENYRNIIAVGYCDLQYLLRYEEARYYTAGVYGWNADIYEIDSNTVIVTGYRPFSGTLNVDYTKVREYDEKASKIQFDYSKSYEKNAEKVRKLLKKFIEEVKEENQK